MIALSVVAGWAGACAAQASEAEVRKAFEARYPGVEVESVTRTPMQGIFEIYANGIVLYADEKVNYLIAEGRLVDAKTRTDLTAERLRKLQAIGFDALPLNDAFTMVRGSGKRRVAYFADPNCGFCKKFERELLNAKDVTIHVFLYPILSNDSMEKARSVWCSKDRAKAWNDWMLKNVVPTAASSCDNPIDRVVKFGRQRGIGGTPTLIFADGTRVPGMIPAGDFNKLLDATAK
ncbi:MAG: DsbC family protein [Betaproteobacteria bacterium]|nr:MAG: DsbC family protein [Betaproteobacteria bacterium]